MTVQNVMGIHQIAVEILVDWATDIKEEYFLPSSTGRSEVRLSVFLSPAAQMLAVPGA